MARELAFEPSTLNREITLKGLTPEAFAEAADIHVATLYRALRGDSLKPRSFTKILETLGRLPAVRVPDGLVKTA